MQLVAVAAPWKLELEASQPLPLPPRPRSRTCTILYHTEGGHQRRCHDGTGVKPRGRGRCVGRGPGMARHPLGRGPNRGRGWLAARSSKWPASGTPRATWVAGKTAARAEACPVAEWNSAGRMRQPEGAPTKPPGGPRHPPGGAGCPSPRWYAGPVRSPLFRHSQAFDICGS